MQGVVGYGTGLDSSAINKMAELKVMNAAWRVVWGQGQGRSPLVALISSEGTAGITGGCRWGGHTGGLFSPRLATGNAVLSARERTCPGLGSLRGVDCRHRPSALEDRCLRVL